MKTLRPSLLRRYPTVSAVLCGLAAAACVPPLPGGGLVLFVLGAGLACLRPVSGWGAFRWGMAWGLTFHLTTLLWIRHVMSVGPVVAIGGGLVLMMTYLSLFPALWAWGWTSLRDRRWPWMWPFLFAGIEIFRGFGQMSFPWSHVAYDLGSSPILLQGVAWAGVHGTGFLIALGAVAAERSLRTGSGRIRSLLALACLAWIGLGIVRLRTESTGPTLDVAVVQPAIPQTRKWDEAYFRSVMDQTHRTLSRLRDRVDLVVLPETAIPDFWSLRPSEVSRFRRFSDSARADLMIGALDFDRDSTAPRGAWIRNSAFLLSPGRGAQRYDKVRLVPFSERLPFDDVFPILNFVDLGEGDFSAGSRPQVWRSAGVPWAPTICYELAYADFVREVAKDGAEVLVDITNDGWFGESWGPRQHWNIERFRAVESGLPLVRSANTGISGVVDRNGRILVASRLMDDTLLVARVRAGTPTFAAKHGGVVEGILAFAGLLVLLSVVVPFPRRRRSGLISSDNS